MPETRFCIQCSSLFMAPPSKKTQHCSDACSRKTQAEKRLLPLKTTCCGYCGTAMHYRQERHKKRYCNNKCRGLARVGVPPTNKLLRETRGCKNCQSPFIVRVNSDQFFCSKACGNASRKGKYFGFTNRVTLSCQICHKEFTAAMVRKDVAKYCSYACMAKAKTLLRGAAHPLYRAASHLIKKCAYCGKIFRTTRPRVLIGQGRFCSRKCVGAWISQRQKGRISSIERIVAAVLSAINEPYLQQLPLGPWTVDFYLPQRNLVIECDGDYWHSLPKVQNRDKRKDAWMKKHGYIMVRLQEQAIRVDAAKLVTDSLRAVA